MNELKDLLMKSPLEMPDEELRASIEKLQSLRKIPELKSLVYKKRDGGQQIDPLEEALRVASMRKKVEEKQI